MTEGGMVVGTALGGELVRIPLCGLVAIHVLAAGATGSGKTVFFVLAARAGIERGMGLVFIDPKGDDFARGQLAEAARRAGRGFYEWAPDGGCLYNPSEQGSDTELVDKLLAGEVWSEIELTPKTRARLQRTLRGYLRNHNVAGIRYHASESVADAVERAARATGAHSILELAPLPSTVAPPARW